MTQLQTIGGGHKPSTTPADTVSEENHMQVAVRLGLGGGLVFAHGKPTAKVKKQH